MLDERKAKVLEAVIEKYTDTAQPVGSSSIGSLDNFSVSAATIRNDMAALETEGYLRQPHTSAGRVPTQKGYRHFVDQIDSTTINVEEKQKVSDFFAQMRGEIEEVLRDTAGLLARLTDCAAVVVDGPDDLRDVKSVQLVVLQERVLLAVAVLDTGQVVKHTIEFADPVEPVSVHAAEQLLAESMVGLPLSKGKVLPANNDEGAVLIASEFYNAISKLGVDSDRVYVDGTSRVAGGFEAVESVSKVLSILEQQLVVVSLLSDVVDSGVSVSIGSETGVAPLSECSLVVSPYEIAGDHGGSIAVLGPTRMNYPQAMAAVAAVSRQLGNRLSEG